MAITDYHLANLAASLRRAFLNSNKEGILATLIDELAQQGIEATFTLADRNS